MCIIDSCLYCHYNVNFDNRPRAPRFNDLYLFAMVRSWFVFSDYRSELLSELLSGQRREEVTPQTIGSADPMATS